MTIEEIAGRVCLIRGGGDLATGVAWRLFRAGFPVVVTEIARPLTVRRSVALSTAVHTDRVEVEGMAGVLGATPEEAMAVALAGQVGVVVSAALPAIGADVVIDARMAKTNIDTKMTDAGLVIGMGPGFVAGEDCHAVIETLRGPRLGRVIWSGPAAANTGSPGAIAGHSAERVLRAPAGGSVRWMVEIGATVSEGQGLGLIGEVPIHAPFAGLVRGLILDGSEVLEGMKIGDLDARLDVNPHEISDKALSVGGGVLEAVLAGAPL